MSKVELAQLLVDAVVVVVVPFVGWAVRRWVADKLTAERRRQVVDGARVVYHVIEGIAARTPGTVDDKLALALRRLTEHLGRDLTPAEHDVAVDVLASEAQADKRRGSINLGDLKLR